MGRLGALATPERETLRVGVSACLLGQEVRFDGGHKRDSFLVETLARFVEFVPVCPEFELGLGIPRESIRLERRGEEIHLIGVKSRADHTAAMRRYAERRVDQLAKLDLCGYVLKKNSPSCGMERVRIYSANGMPARNGRGLFADALLHALPLPPVEEEGRLKDARLRENFIQRIFGYRRLRTFFDQNWTYPGLIEFHTAHKLQLMAHAPRAYRELGRLVANGRKRDHSKLRDEYQTVFMGALAKIATPARHVNVMQHMAGYLREFLDPPSRDELAGLFEDYRNGLTPLMAPLTLLRHYVRRFDISYLQRQTYLEPHPKELMLRNRV